MSFDRAKQLLKPAGLSSVHAHLGKRPVLKSLGGLAIVATAAVYWGSPLVVVGQFSHAIATGNAVAVNGLIDFPALRSSLKAEAQQVALYRLSGHQKPGTNGLAGLAFLVMEPFVNGLVDTVATPEGVRGLLNSQDALRSQGPSGGSRPIAQLESLGQGLAKTRFGYRSWNTFVVTTKDQSNRTLGLTFDRRGFSNWKLVAVDLPSDGTFTP